MRAAEQCFEYRASKPPDAADSDEVGTATYVVVGVLTVVGLLAAYAVIHELCKASSDPNCSDSVAK